MQPFEQEIKQALRNAGLADTLSDKITVKTVDEIAGAVSQLKTDMDKSKSYTTEELVNILKNAGLDEAFKKALQSETDRRVTEAIKTHDEKLKKDAEDKAAKDKTKGDQETMTPEQKEIASLRDTVKTLVDEIGGIKKNITTSDMSSRIRAELKKAGLSEEFETEVKVDNPDKIADAVTTFKGKLDGYHQAIIDKKLADGELASVKQGAAGKTVEQGNIADYAKSLGKGGAVKNLDFPGKISSPEPAVAQAAAP